MVCEFCGKEPRHIMVLPLHTPNGSLVSFACFPCGKASTAYCRKHEEIHRGFEDGTTACVSCIEELVRTEQTYPPTILHALYGALPREEMAQLIEAAESASSLVGGSVRKSIYRFLATKALRTGRSCGDVAAEMIQKRSIEPIWA